MKSMPMSISLAVLMLGLVACSSDKSGSTATEPAVVEPAAPTQGQVISEQLHKPLDDAKNVEKVLQQEANDLDKQLEEQTKPADDAVTP